MTDKFRGKYRILCEYNHQTNDFNRKLNGTLEDIDCYISCMSGNKIFHYGGNVLQCYIPSITSGRNIIKQLYAKYINPNNITTEMKEYDVERDGKQTHITKESINIVDKNLYKFELKKSNNIIFDIEESDSEVLFKFKYVDSDKIIPLLKPRTSGANISPFSPKNLPRNKDYIISGEELKDYEAIKAKIPSEYVLRLGLWTNNYLKSLVTKRNTWDDIKADIRLKGLKPRDYIHCIGKWEDYIKYLGKCIDEMENI